MSHPSDQRKKSICIATPDIASHARNGGVGAACFEIARLWRHAGHDVTVLYANSAGAVTAKDDSWRLMYENLGIEIVICPDDQRSGLISVLQRPWNAWKWLCQRKFDVIYFPERAAVGLYTIQAKRAGLGFETTTMMVGAHSPTNWHSSSGMTFPKSVEEVLLDAAERQCTELCDILISPSHYMVDYMRKQGWHLPHDVRTIPNPCTRKGIAWSDERRPVSEIVFFGHLEQRKELQMFIRALGALPKDMTAKLKVTFLGKAGDMPGDALEYIRSNCVSGFADWNVVDTLDAEGALAYLTKQGRLAVMPSLVENSPMAVRECLAMGIPFVASAVGGTSELIAHEMHDELLFEPRPSALLAHVLRAVEQGARPGRAAFTETSVTEAWLETLKVESAVSVPATTPKVSVVVTTFNRPDLLDEALEGLRQQSWNNLEIVLVDDGSTNPAAIAKLDSLEPEFAAAGWQILRQVNSYLGAARNTGWRAATGDLVIFHDDDNYSPPDLVETYVRAISVSGADIATCTMAPFSGDRPLGESRDSLRVFAFVGNAAGAGLVANAFGDAHACFRRSVLETIGGFTENYGVGHEDWEIFARASLKGFKIITVPEPLFWYRESAHSMLRGRQSPDPDFMRSLRPYLDAVPAALRPTLEYLAYLAMRASGVGRPDVDALVSSAQAAPDGVEPHFIGASRWVDPSEIAALCLAPYPEGMRDETVLRDVCMGKIPAWQLVRLSGFTYTGLRIIRRLRRIGSNQSRMRFTDLVLAGLPSQIRSEQKILDIASFRLSWERIAMRYPTRSSYWLAARNIQREMRRLRWR